MIGIFDSGIGGFTVLRALRRIAPHADVVYFGDTAHAPYANRDQRTLEWLTLDAFRFLRSHGATHLISACNSVSASVVRPLLSVFGSNGSIIEMVGPTAAYVNALGAQRVVVIATPATVQSGMYNAEIANSISIACPHLSGLIERGATHDEIAADVDVISREIAAHQPDLIVLGCTHYPHVLRELREACDARGCFAEIIDPADAVAQAAIDAWGDAGSGLLHIYSSSPSDTFDTYAQNLFHCSVLRSSHESASDGLFS